MIKLLNSRSNIYSVANSRVVIIGLLIAILFAHIWLRENVDSQMPLSIRHFYSNSYAAAISLCLDGKFQNISFDPKIAAHKPFIDFLNLRKMEITPQESAALAASGFFSKAGVSGPDKIQFDRPLELLIAGWLWAGFGISWHVIQFFYILLSAIGGVMFFFLVRSITGSSWCGIFAALLLCISPTEGKHVVWSLRDWNPYWFTLLATTVLFCATGRWQTAQANAGSYFLLGLCSLIGLGWRSDALYIPAITLCGLIPLLLRQGRSTRHLVFALALFFVGVLVAHKIVTLMRSPFIAPKDGSFTTVFHVSHYAEYKRSEMGSYENSFQISRSDGNTSYQANLWYARHHPGQPLPRYFSQAYGFACLEMFLDIAKMELFRWGKAFPGFYIFDVIEGMASSAYGGTKNWAAPWALDLKWPLTGLMFLSVFIFLIQGQRRLEILFFFGFSIYYSLLLWIMLPEIKHVTPMVMPIIVLSTLGGHQAIRLLCSSAARKELADGIRANGRKTLLASCAILAVYGLFLEISYGISRTARSSYLADVERLRHTGKAAPEAIKTERVFYVESKAAHSNPGAAYLLTIDTSSAADPVCVRYMLDAGKEFESDFALSVGIKRHYLFLTCDQLEESIKPQSNRWTVILPKEARFAACERLDLSTWTHLPFATIFYEGQNSPGSPTVNFRRQTTRFVNISKDATFGLTGQEEIDLQTPQRSRLRVEMGLGAPRGQGFVLVPGATLPLDKWDSAGATPPTTIHKIAEGISVASPPIQWAYVLVYPPLTVEQPGDYLIKISLRVSSGDVSIGILSNDRNHWVGQCGTPTAPGQKTYIKEISYNYEKGDLIHLVIFNTQPNAAIFEVLSTSISKIAE